MTRGPRTAWLRSIMIAAERVSSFLQGERRWHLPARVLVVSLQQRNNTCPPAIRSGDALYTLPTRLQSQAMAPKQSQAFKAVKPSKHNSCQAFRARPRSCCSRLREALGSLLANTNNHVAHATKRDNELSGARYVCASWLSYLDY